MTLNRSNPLWTSADVIAATSAGVIAATSAGVIAATSAGAPKSDWVANGVSIDSRTLEPGDLFVAIKGPHVDGHDYVDAAFKAGAAAAIVASDWSGQGEGELRSEERRVGDEGRSRWSPYH